MNQQKLINDLTKAAMLIGQSSSHGSANWIILNQDVADVMIQIEIRKTRKMRIRSISRMLKRLDPTFP